MVSARLIAEARRRAGLSQRELAERVGTQRPEISRYERGRARPSLERLRAIVAACGLELTVGLANADDSYDRSIREAFAMPPAERLRSSLAGAASIRTTRALAHGETPPPPMKVVAALKLLRSAGVTFVLVGEMAEVLHGSPILPTEGRVTIVPRDGEDDRLPAAIAAGGGRRLAMPRIVPVEGTRWRFERFGVELVVEPRPAGTRGYDDLHRDARELLVGDDLVVPVASLLDLMRIADASPDLAVRARSAALRRTLELADQADGHERAHAA